MNDDLYNLLHSVQTNIIPKRLKRNVNLNRICCHGVRVRQVRLIFDGVYFNFPQAEMYNGLKSVETICYRADGSRGSAFQSQRLEHIFPRGISIPCEKLKCARVHSQLSFHAQLTGR